MRNLHSKPISGIRLKAGYFSILMLLFLFAAGFLPEKAQPKTEEATFAEGCFWHTEEFFLNVKGVSNVMPGYAGGSAKDANYNTVSSGNTHHAEAVNFRYDPSVISYNQLLEIFFGTHDPTTLNRQDPDVGPQYRSVIFYHNAQQKKHAEEYITKLNAAKKFKNPIVTQILPFTAFYKAEPYHFRYYRNHPENPYIKNVTKPQVDKFKKDFRQYLKSS